MLMSQYSCLLLKLKCFNKILIVPVADVPKEDMITQLPETNAFLRQAIAEQGIVLVHWYVIQNNINHTYN